MARIVFATFGSLGDLHPVLALAHELRQRGHTVAVATSELYRTKITTLGFDFAALRPAIEVADEAMVRRIMDGAGGPEYLLRGLLLPAVRDMHADLARATAGADVLVANELVYAAPLLAEQTSLKWISYALAPLSYFSTHDPCMPPVALGGAWLHALPPAAIRVVNGIAKAMTHSWWRPVREFRRELGLPPGRNPLFSGKHSPRLDLALFSPVLQPPQPDWPASTVQTGFCFYDETDDAPAAAKQTAGELPATIETFLAAGDSPIVFTLGSSAVFAAGDFYAHSASAAQTLGRRALLLLGNNPPPSNLPRTILTWDYLPFAAVFPRAAAIVHQGGVGTTAQALRAGRPMLVVPFAFDQPDNAARVTRLGAARTLVRSRYEAKSAVRELAALLGEQRCVQTAEAVGARLRAERGAVAACDALAPHLG